MALSCSCAGNNGEEQQKSAFFDKKETTDDVQNEHFDLDKIQESGEKEAATYADRGRQKAVCQVG